MYKASPLLLPCNMTVYEHRQVEHPQSIAQNTIQNPIQNLTYNPTIDAIDCNFNRLQPLIKKKTWLYHVPCSTRPLQSRAQYKKRTIVRLVTTILFFLASTFVVDLLLYCCDIEYCCMLHEHVITEICALYIRVRVL